MSYVKYPMRKRRGFYASTATWSRWLLPSRRMLIAALWSLSNGSLRVSAPAGLPRAQLRSPLRLTSPAVSKAEQNPTRSGEAHTTGAGSLEVARERYTPDPPLPEVIPAPATVQFAIAILSVFMSLPTVGSDGSTDRMSAQDNASAIAVIVARSPGRPVARSTLGYASVETFEAEIF